MKTYRTGLLLLVAFAPDLDIVAQQWFDHLGPVGLLTLVLGGDAHDQPPPGQPGRLDGQVRRLLLVGPAEEDR
jgi:hypothetical protein